MTITSTRSLLAAVCFTLWLAAPAFAAEKPAAAPAKAETPASAPVTPEAPAAKPETPAATPEATLMPAIEVPVEEDRARLRNIPRTVDLHDSDEKISIFTDVLPVKDVLRKYPFLNEAMPGMRPNSQMRLGRQQFGDVTLLYFFLNLRDEQGVCGSLGCPMTVWADEGFGYHKVMDILKKYFTGVFVRSKEGQLSMIFCDPVRGQSNWDFEKGTFKHKSVNQDAPDCQDKSEKIVEPDTIFMKGADEPESEETSGESSGETGAAEDKKPGSEEKPLEDKAPATP